MTHKEILEKLVKKVNAREGTSYAIKDFGDDLFSLSHTKGLVITGVTTHWERILEELIKLV